MFFNNHNVQFLRGISVSHSKTVYVITHGHLRRLKNNGVAKCAKCFQSFNENDIIATSTSRRYCYKCAIQINLVTGKITRDLDNDEFISDVSYQIESIGAKIKINEHVSKLATLLVTTAIKNINYVSKNKLGLACAAIFLACDMKKQIILSSTLPVSQKTLQKNMGLLQKNLTSTDIYTLSEIIYGMKN